MKQLALLLTLTALTLAGFHAPRLARLHGDVPSSATSSTITPAKPRHWTLVIPQWQPVTSAHWEHMTGAEKVAEHELGRSAVDRAARDDSGSTILPASWGPLRVTATVTLSPRQHTPSPASIWPAVERALEAGAALRGGRGELKFMRSGSKGEYGVELRIEEVR